MGLKIEKYGTMPDGAEISKFTLRNENGISATIINYGAIIESIMVPDRDGQSADILLGFDNLEDWRTRNVPYFGAVIGRCANRIGGGRFAIAGKQYQLAINNGPNCLHGGVIGFDKKVWSVADSVDGAEPSVTLSLHSPDGDENFPGNLDCSVKYSLGADNGLRIDYKAVTDQPTIVNLTNHAYFNLGGHDAGHIGGHTIQVAADRYTPNDENHLPLGTIESLDGKDFDFRSETSLGECLRKIGALDHNYLLADDHRASDVIAVVSHPESGRRMEVCTSEPGMQLYSADYLDGIVGKGGTVYDNQSAICLEAQRCPDAINHDNFPNVILRPGEVYRQTSIYRFV
jgi:aldose 1-epimerase